MDTRTEGNTIVVSPDPVKYGAQITNDLTVPLDDLALGAIKGKDIYDRLQYVELHAYDNLWIDTWNITQPNSPFIGQTWYNTTDTIKAWNGTSWSTIPMSFYKMYIKGSANPKEVYSWNGVTMIAVSVPLTKAVIESLLTGNITSHTHNAASVIAMGIDELELALITSFK